ncbi:MAG: hypothetical protein HYY51_00540 [Candidatus Magasanikbacteria bacterium]|nr:hypothetical protein [Candidatus Magasanikbacteria bacterium]
MPEDDLSIGFRFSRREWESARLTPQLARDNPNLYKVKLINSLGFEREGQIFGGHSKKVWEYLVSSGTFDFGSIQLDPDSFVSYSRSSERVIQLGAAPIPAELKGQILFDDAAFGREEEALYRFSHEVSHPFAAELATKDQRVDNIYRTAYTARNHGSGRGFSGLGSLDFYKSRGPEVQAKEDATELVNMYLWNEDYFDRFLIFLSDPRYAEERENAGLVAMDQVSGDRLKRIIVEAVSRLIA